MLRHRPTLGDLLFGKTKEDFYRLLLPNYEIFAAENREERVHWIEFQGNLPQDETEVKRNLGAKLLGNKNSEILRRGELDGGTLAYALMDIAPEVQAGIY